MQNCAITLTGMQALIQFKEPVRRLGDNNFLQAVHFCFISIFEGALFCFVLNVQRKMGRKLNY